MLKRLILQRTTLGRAAAPALDDDVRAEQVRALYRSLHTSLLILPFIVAVIVDTLWGAVPTPALLGWSAAIIVMTGVRLSLRRRYFRADPAPDRAGAWLKAFVVALAVHTAIIGSAAWLIFPADNMALQLLLILAIVGIASGGVITLASHVPSTAIFVALILSPLALQFAFRDHFPDVYGALVVVYAVVVVSGSRDFNRSLVHTLRAQAERRVALDKLQLAKDEAEAANAAKSNFLANMSHELRTPLNAIIGFSDMVMSGLVDPSDAEAHTEYIKHINEAGHHLLALVGDILDVSNIETGRIELDQQPVDLAAAVDSSFSLMAGEADSKGVTLSKIIGSDLPMLRADEGRLKQVVVNILSNAIKFTPAGGSVTILADGDSQRGITLEVSDTGKGIDPEDIPAALSTFSQVEWAHDGPVDGAGLGLPISKALVEGHGGTLELESRETGGTIVRIAFPPERTISNLPNVSEADAA